MLPKSIIDAMKNCRRIMEENPHLYDKETTEKQSLSINENRSDINMIRYIMNERNRFILK